MKTDNPYSLIEAKKISKAIAIELGRDVVRNNRIGQYLRLQMRLKHKVKLGGEYDKCIDRTNDCSDVGS